MNREASLTFKMTVICTCKLPSTDHSSAHPASRHPGAWGRLMQKCSSLSHRNMSSNIEAGGSAMITKARHACTQRACR